MQAETQAEMQAETRDASQDGMCCGTGQVLRHGTGAAARDMCCGTREMQAETPTRDAKPRQGTQAEIIKQR